MNNFLKVFQGIGPFIGTNDTPVVTSAMASDDASAYVRQISLNLLKKRNFLALPHDVHLHVVVELTVVYVTARTFDTQIAAKEQLDLSRQTTDETLHYLKYWPGIDEDGHMYQSPYLFSAVLEHHRTLVKVGCTINRLFRPQPHSI